MHTKSLQSHLCQTDTNQSYTVTLYCLLSSEVMSNSLQLHGLYSLLGSPIHGISQVRILEWVVISSSSISS